MNKDYEEFLKLLNYHKVKYVIVGAYALATYAEPRFTGDLDILIEVTKENAERVMKALQNFGFGSLGLNTGDFLKKDHVVQLGYKPVRIDIQTSLTAVSWEEVWENKAEGAFGDQKIYFIGKDQLIKNKKAIGRPKDLLDLEMLEP